MNNSRHHISKDANAWLLSHIGNYKILDACRCHSPRTGVWRLKGETANYYFKINRRRNRWGSEVYAYQNWVPAIEPYAPRLHAVYDCADNPGLLLSEMPGKPLSETAVEGRAMEESFFKAGNLLRRLHDSMNGEWFGFVDEKGSPIDGQGNPLHAELLHDLPRQKLEVLNRLLQNADSMDCFEPSERRILQWAVESVGCYESEQPIPTSEDYTPGNWLVDSAGNLAAIIDFENMLWGDRMFPFSRLLNDYFPFFPGAENSFYEGYGGCPPGEQPIQAKIACAIYAGNYVTQGIKSKNAGYLNRGKAAFQRILSS